MRHPPPRSTLFPYTTLFRSLFRIDAFRAKQHRTNALRERTLKHGFHREFSRQHALKIDDRDHACVRPLRSSHLHAHTTESFWMASCPYTSRTRRCVGSPPSRARKQRSCTVPSLEKTSAVSSKVLGAAASSPLTFPGRRMATEAPSASSRFLATAIASSAMSEAKAWRWLRAAASAVVPEPEKKSATKLRSRVCAFTNISNNSTGFCVGYPVRSFAILLIEGISTTSGCFFSWPLIRLDLAGVIGGSKNQSLPLVYQRILSCFFGHERGDEPPSP